jgi:hypothetical protein
MIAPCGLQGTGARMSLFAEKSEARIVLDAHRNAFSGSISPISQLGQSFNGQ